jgi:hypothetical protein
MGEPVALVFFGEFQGEATGLEATGLSRGLALELEAEGSRVPFRLGRVVLV